MGGSRSGIKAAAARRWHALSGASHLGGKRGFFCGGGCAVLFISLAGIAFLPILFALVAPLTNGMRHVVGFGLSR
jgi:hypothetical protein